LSKKRIHELAKSYDMSGKDLAAKLRDLGFSHIKSHMTALDDFEWLQAQGVLEAHGLVAKQPKSESVEEDDLETLSGGLIKRKKKRKAAGGTDTTTSAAVEAPAKQTAPKKATPQAPERVEAEPRATIPATAPPQAEDTEAAEDTAAPAEVSREAASQVTDATSNTGTDTAEPTELVGAEGPASPEAEAAPEAEGDTQVAEVAEASEKVAPKSAKPAGNVVGFIDLSKIQAAPKKSESRKLRSRDDVLPDVHPTLRHDSKRSMLRGDRGSRDSLTAAQLREREAGRYRRHQRPSGGGRGGRGGRAGGFSSRTAFEGSPHAGTTIAVDVPVTIKKLAEGMAIKGNQLMKVAFRELGFGTVTITSVIDEDTASLLAQEFEVELKFVREVEAEEALIEALKASRAKIDDEHLEVRNPTVAFLGHVDHGKTTLIDKIRSSQVAEGESGGITQHIGAYRVTTELGHRVTIIDTPGHAAFTSMRARGAQAVDVVVLVVAADAGVQPQTEEALNHARAAEVPIVVALNKIDRAEANPQKALEQLAGLNLIPEDWGGETAVMPVSGITGEGLQGLLERIFLESEILELNCHADGPASGVVLEAEIQQGKGIVAHLLVQDGTLCRGDVILAGEGYGRVRSIHDDFGNEIQTGGPSVPVEVSGLSALPGIGEPFHVVKKLDEAKKVAEERARTNRASSMVERRTLDNAALLQQVAGPRASHVNLVIRADVQGSAEVLRSALSEAVHEEVETRILQSGVGAVTENDVLLASTGDALVIAFNVGVGSKARQTAERENVTIQNFSVLYDVINAVHEIMEGCLAPAVAEEITGHTEVRKLFKSSKIGNIAGCMVLDGSIARNCKLRVLRDDTVIFTGKLASLRREADDAKEVREGFECGLVVHNYGDIREGDVIESFKTVETKRTLDSAPLSS
jgi:translation initiation factor IF-2